MLEPIQSNPIFNEIVQKAHSDTQKLKYIIEYLIKYRNEAKHIYSTLDITQSTIKDYQLRIDRFLDFCQCTPIDNNIYLNYKKHLNESCLKPTTVNKYLVVAKVLIKELARQGLINDITINTKLNKVGSHHKKFGHSIEEIKKIKQFFDSNKKTPKIARLEAIYHLAAIYGLRRNEIRLLDYENIDFSNNRIQILGKGRIDHEFLYISEKSKKLLKDYVELWKINSGPLFISVSNNSKNKRISNDGINYLYQDIKTICDTKASLHGFRHFFTTTLIKKGVPLNKVKKLTRHKSLGMLVVYNDEVSSQEEMIEIHDDVFADIV